MRCGHNTSVSVHLPSLHLGGYVGVEDARFLVDHLPSLILQVKYVQVVELISHFVEASEDDHVVTDDVAGVTCSTERSQSLKCVRLYLDLIPTVPIEVEGPEIVQLLVVLAASAKYVHLVLIDAS